MEVKSILSRLRRIEKKYRTGNILGGPDIRDAMLFINDHAIAQFL